MAKRLTNIPINLTEYPNSFKRQGAFPLEAYEVFNSIEDAENYARTNLIAYVGQKIVVSTETTTTFYVIKNEVGDLLEYYDASMLYTQEAIDGKLDEKSDEFDILIVDGGNATNAKNKDW